MSTLTYVIPGEPVKDFTFQHLGSTGTDATNTNFFTDIGMLQGSHLTQLIGSNTQIHSEEIISPIVLAQKAKNNEGETTIEVTVVIFDTYNEPLKKEDLCINQNFTIGIDGRHQLSYYISYKRSDKERTKQYKANLLTFKNIPFTCIVHEIEDHLTPVDPAIIDDVMAFSINTNPKASRGTVTTVKPPVS